ncbi:efflux RND transporter periplasmic adaptor subunit [Pelagicoccus mobilis]|uniref:Efflux RND transporter periplasmic adaptor subunit n=1 Tax=Pelagicoccus mobilis TaxID=415221 RepID=A0A934VSB7_9BACT|nr:efflux RND transporter periplasmic adaptor subunit [Pelagicoccus mobilis]MBK1878840.1 efflux RND transporter periplasmic adaptor subunit [Pelagicoccus mobilis]
MKNTKLIINLIGAPVLLVVMVALAVLMVKGRKAPPTFPKKEVVISVVVNEASPQTVTPVVQTFGTTQSYYSTLVSSQVGGEIIEMSPDFEVGNSLAKGDWLVKINPADFEANLASRRAALANAITALAEEETRSLLAKEDWLSAGKALSQATDLTLRKPQLAAAKAAVQSAKSAVAQAELDLERTTIVAPFDAIVDKRTASLGDVVSRGAGLGSILARERIQVRVPITPSQAARLRLPHFGENNDPLSATLTSPTIPNAEWEASIGRVEPLIDPRNQSVYLVGDIEDPFENQRAFLPVGAFVNVSISAEPINEVFTFREAAVVEDAFVWVVSPDSTLAKQEIDIVFTQEGQILAKIESPKFPFPLQALELPLASLKEGQKVKAIHTDSN